MRQLQRTTDHGSQSSISSWGSSYKALVETKILYRSRRTFSLPFSSLEDRGGYGETEIFTEHHKASGIGKDTLDTRILVGIRSIYMDFWYIARLSNKSNSKVRRQARSFWIQTLSAQCCLHICSSSLHHHLPGQNWEGSSWQLLVKPVFYTKNTILV